MNKLLKLIERTSNKNLKEHLINDYFIFKNYLIAIGIKENAFCSESNEFKEISSISADETTKNIIIFLITILIFFMK